MQLAPFLLGGVALFAISRKKKKRTESSVPKIERFGRVERLLNVAAARESDAKAQGLTIPPMVVFMYQGKTPALERVTKAMMAQAQAFQNVEFYQLPVSVAKAVSKTDGALPKGSAGFLAGVHGANFFGEFIFPNDDPAMIAGKVSRRTLFAITGKESTGA